MRFPRPMPEHKFDNEYDVIIFALSAILDQLEKKDHIFAAQCIWWLTSIIQYTEILLFYRQYNIFLSYYVKNCIVTPLTKVNMVEELGQEILELELAEVILEKSDSSTLRRNSATTRRILGSTRSGKVFKPQKVRQKMLAEHYPGQSNTQLQEIQNSLRKDGLIL